MKTASALGLAFLLGACAAPAPAPQRMSVFFTPWSAQFDDGASAVLNQVAKEMREAPGRSVTIVGSADPEGSVQANQEISRLRTQVVYDKLVSGGVAPGRIRRDARGPVNYVAMPMESRRVDMIIAE